MEDVVIKEYPSYGVQSLLFPKRMQNGRKIQGCGLGLETHQRLISAKNDNVYLLTRLITSLTGMQFLSPVVTCDKVFRLCMAPLK